MRRARAQRSAVVVHEVGAIFLAPFQAKYCSDRLGLGKIEMINRFAEVRDQVHRRRVRILDRSFVGVQRSLMYS